MAKAFAPSKVQKLAGPLPYLRGMSYYSDGRVEPADGDGAGVHARVRGTMPYAVRLWMDGGRPAWSCTCPAAEDGSFCKDCVAVAIVLDRDAGGSDEGSPAPVPADELSDFVRQLPRDRLVEIVLEQAGSDWRLREGLLAEDRAARGVAPDQEAWRRRLDRVFTPYDRFVSHREAAGWADGIDQVIDGLEDMCEAGHPDAVMALTEYAYRCADQAVEYVDDSDGHLWDISERLAGLHGRACWEGRPDPAELASRLVELDLDSTLEGFYGAVVGYAEILGEAGLAAYREHLDRRRAEMEERRDQGRGSDYALSRIGRAQVDWARAVADPDVLIDTITGVRERLYPSDVMEIIKSLTSAGREDEAVDWAERGLRENRGSWRYTSDLRDYLAGALRERGEGSAAVDLYWDAFRSDPSLAAYRRLVQEADGEAGVDTDWLRLCVEDLRGRLVPQDAGAETAGRGAASRLARPLLDILLYEGRVEEAWDAAKDFGCDQQMWLTLAGAREQTHPLDAIGVYEPEVWAQIKLMKNHAYEKAVDLMDRIRRLADAVDEPHRFADLLDQVRTEHWRKRNLKKLLDSRGWDQGGDKGARARSAPANVHLVRLPKRDSG